MRKLFLLLPAFLAFLSLAPKAEAFYNPIGITNNHFGIHITDLADLEDAAKLVNSNGGDWGYITFIIQKTERNKEFWQLIFDKCRRLHLIPIVRIATRPQGETWEKPSLGDIDGWVTFLNSLNWVIQNRYLVIGNEPNHSKEWGDEINPEEYTDYLTQFSQKLKKVSDNFFVLPAGFDSSAGSTKETMDEYTFLKRMYLKDNNFLSSLDGWTSHSYPNPAFSGSETDSGRASIRSYNWELTILKDFGLNRQLPIFITETGWAHQVEGGDKKLLKVGELGQKYKYAFGSAWTDNRIVAITPFVLSYSQSPFDVFSWKDKSGNFYSFYSDVQALAKTAGKPIQIDNADIMAFYVFPYQISGSRYSGIFLVKNIGQAIWNKSEFSLKSRKGENPTISSTSFSDLEPGGVGLISFSGVSEDIAGTKQQAVALLRNGKQISKDYSFHIITITPLRMKIEALLEKLLQLVKQ